MKTFDIEEMLFRQKQLEAEKPPPTKLIHAIDHAHYQSMIWNRDTVPHQHFPPFTDYDWLLNKDDFTVPIMVSLPPAPNAILELVKCDCLKSNCTNLRCKCLRNKLKCADLCGCNGERRWWRM